MAGDKKKEQRNVIREQGDYWRTLSGQHRMSTLEPQYRQMRDFYMQAAPKQMADYDQMMSGYRDFQNTGGYSGRDISNIRGRTAAPIRAVYGRAAENVARQRALQGGYSPGYGVLQARLAREQGQSMSDAATGAEAEIAQMINAGKRFGLQGGTSLYGTTPAQAALFGNQVLAASGQLGQNIGQEGDFAQGIIGAHQRAQELPGRWEGTVGRIGDVIGLGRDVGSVIYPWL